MSRLKNLKNEQNNVKHQLEFVKYPKDMTIE